MRPVLALLLAGLCAAPLAGQAFHKRSPNTYRRTEDDNAATRLDARLADGSVELPSQGRRGRLLALLRALEIPVESQTLVFSKTSLQRHRISPANPRALYFNSDAYVGWIPGAASLEVAVGDDRLGVAFYTLTQDPAQRPRLVRDDTCLRCHASTRTHDEPGLLLRSVFPDEVGDPIVDAGEADMDFRQPIADRWGGWLVTGTFVGTHRGNGIAEDDGRGGYLVASKPAADLTALADAFGFAADTYPVATSDIGALLALEQQAAIHNLMVRASLQTRYLLDKDRVVNEILDEQGMRAQTRRIVDDLARQLAAALLLDGEADLSPHACAPEPGFARAFAARWPRSGDDIGLGTLDLHRRTFTLPLSPMVHAPAFGRMPDELRRRVLQRLQVAIVRGVPPGDVRLTRDERSTLDAHLRATLPGWPPRAQ
ncbi:MAG: hypothetical protein ACE37K_22045 [Planctomycetota bacterium]